MKKLSLLLTFGLLSLGLHSQAKPAIRISASHLLNDERKVSDFTGIAIGGSVKAYVKLGNTESLRLEGDQEAIDELITEVKNGTLSIKPKKSQWNEWFKKFGNSKVTAYITAKKLTNLAVAGSGSIEVEQAINANSFDVAISGSGNIKATINAQSIDAAISGSGGLNISGKTKKAEVAISGSGNFSGKELSADDVQAHISGSGSVHIQAQKSLEAAISGSGNINYTGNPTISKAIAGSGKVRKID
ncbi:head GIN domain-containing protein [Pedobacter gandavensis]|uniref:head GIN domain-containing protein n=1 Tax=Pedobacter gandavensis TaxID=2679963 RepID=UPI00292E9717|nr:head GIN domain-containing protein [Pedobacter gandavensis]